MKKLFGKGRRYRITVENITEQNVSPAEREQMQFEVTDREDLFAIVEKIKKGTDLELETATALGVGIRLFGGVMLKHKKTPLFAELMPHFRAFMIGMKKSFKQ